MLPAEPLKQDAPVEPGSLHPDHLVEPDCSGIVGPDEQADPGDFAEEQPDQIVEPPAAVATVSDFRVDPHLLELNRLWRPRGRLGLEENRAVLDPDPGAALVDLLSRSATEAHRVCLQRVDSDLTHMRRCTSGKQQLEVLWSRRAKRRAARLRRTIDREDRLSMPVLARSIHRRLCRVPEVGHGLLVADDHPRSGRRRDLGKGPAALAGRHDVGADMAERRDSVAVHRRQEPAEAPAGGLVEEDAFDGLGRAELEHLLERGFFEMRGQSPQGRRAFISRL